MAGDLEYKNPFSAQNRDAIFIALKKGLDPKNDLKLEEVKTDSVDDLLSPTYWSSHRIPKNYLSQAIKHLHLLKDDHKGIQTRFVKVRTERGITQEVMLRDATKKKARADGFHDWAIMGFNNIDAARKLLSFEEGIDRESYEKFFYGLAKVFYENIQKSKDPEAEFVLLVHNFIIPYIAKQLNISKEKARAALDDIRDFGNFDQDNYLVATQMRVQKSENQTRDYLHISVPMTGDLHPTLQSDYERLADPKKRGNNVEWYYRTKNPRIKPAIRHHAKDILKGKVIPTQLRKFLPGLRNAGEDRVYSLDPKAIEEGRDLVYQGPHSATLGHLLGDDTLNQRATNQTIHQLGRLLGAKHVVVNNLQSPGNIASDDPNLTGQTQTSIRDANAKARRKKDAQQSQVQPTPDKKTSESTETQRVPDHTDSGLTEPLLAPENKDAGNTQNQPTQDHENSGNAQAQVTHFHYSSSPVNLLRKAGPSESHVGENFLIDVAKDVLKEIEDEITDLKEIQKDLEQKNNDLKEIQDEMKIVISKEAGQKEWHQKKLKVLLKRYRHLKYHQIIGLDRENRPLQIASLLKNIASEINQIKGTNYVVIIDPCVSGKDRQGAARFAAIKDAIELDLTGDLVPGSPQDVHVRQTVAQSGHITKQAGMNGGSLGAEGIKSDTESVIPHSWREPQTPLVQPTANYNKKIPKPKRWYKNPKFWGAVAGVLFGGALCATGILAPIGIAWAATALIAGGTTIGGGALGYGAYQTPSIVESNSLANRCKAVEMQRYSDYLKTNSRNIAPSSSTSNDIDIEDPVTLISSNARDVSSEEFASEISNAFARLIKAQTDIKETKSTDAVLAGRLNAGQNQPTPTLEPGRLNSSESCQQPEDTSALTSGHDPKQLTQGKAAGLAHTNKTSTAPQRLVGSSVKADKSQGDVKGLSRSDSVSSLHRAAKLF